MTQTVRRVAVIGGNRIPFARSNGPYSHATNQDMLTAALDGLVDALRPRGRAPRRGRRRRRAQAQPRLQPDPRVRPGQPPGRRHARPTTSSRRAAPASRRRSSSPTRSPSARSRSASPAASTRPPTRRSRVGEDLREILLDANRAKRTAEPPQGAHARSARSTSSPRSRATSEPRTGLSMGEHQARTAARWGITREAQDELTARSHQNLAAAYDRGFHDDLVTPVPRPRARPEPAPRTRRVEKLAKLKPVFGGENGTMTAGNSTPLSDGAAVVLLASEEWASERNLPVLAYFVDAETAAVDYVGGDEGLLMAPAYAMPRMLARAGLSLQDFDLYEIHEAFAVAGPVHARRVGGPGVLQGAPRPRRAARRDRPREAQRQRQLARRRPPVRRDRRADRRLPGQGAARARAAARASSASARPAARASSRSSKEPGQ